MMMISVVEYDGFKFAGYRLREFGAVRLEKNTNKNIHKNKSRDVATHSGEYKL
jgi:hypothetical protein